MRNTVFMAAALAVAISGKLKGENDDAPPDQTNVYDRIWDRAILYENAEGTFVQDFRFSGLIQADAAFFDGDGDGGDYQRLLWRRVRLGFKSSFLDDFILHSEVDLDLNDVDPIEDAYGRFTEAYVAWSPEEYFTLKVGKQSAPFTLDGATSSKGLLTLERSQVATNLWFPTEYFTGLSGNGEAGDWSYHAGIYSSSGDDEFGSFESGWFGLISFGRDLSERTGLDTSSVRLDYVYNDPDYSGDVGTRDLAHVVSLSSKFADGRFGVWTDIAFGSGLGDQGDLFGLQLMPYYDLSERWQLVSRYSFVSGAGDNSVRLNRYESRIEPRSGDEAHEFYLGLNCFLYGHKLKWQNGVEYSYAGGLDGGGDSYSGWGFTSGIRLSW